MKKLLLLVILITTIASAKETVECLRATTIATSIHWQYVQGENNVTLRQSYNATAYMKKVCNLKET